MMDGVHVLYVYDVDDRTTLGPEELALADDALTVDTAHTVSDAIDRLTTAPYDCILSTYQLPDEDGLTFLRHIRDFNTDLPFVLYTDAGSEWVASEAIAAGVTDYVRNDPDADQTEVVTARLVDAVSDGPDDPEADVRELTEATDDVLWLISADWEDVLFINSAYSTIWGQSEAALRADPTAFFDAVHPDDRSSARAALDRLDDGESVEIELRVNPSEEFQRRVLVQAEPIVGQDGTVERIAGASRDVTEQRARQRRLEQEQQMVDSIFNALPDVLYTFDTQGYLLRWNDQLEAETGYSTSEIDDMYVTDFVPDSEVTPIATSFQAIIEDRRSVTVESAFETKAGESVPFEFTGAPLEDADGDLRGVTGIGRNIADRKKQQRRFEAVFNNTYQFTGLAAPDGTLLEVNRTAVEFADRDRDDIVGTKIWDAYWFQSSETARQTARRAVEAARGGDFFREQITVQGADRDAVIDFSVRPVTDESGAVELIIPEGRDITRLSERDRQLRVTNRFLRHNIRNKLTTIQGHSKLISEVDDERVQSSGTKIAEAAADLDETAEMARNIHELIEADPTPATVDLVEQLDRAVADVRARSPHADLSVDAPASLEVTGLPSLNRAVAELLMIVLTNATSDRPTVRIDARESDTGAVEITTGDSGLTPPQQEVLMGDIDIRQTRHARGLEIWYVYWHLWYSGGTATVAENGTNIEVRFSTV
jgi:PAS domain S-box-containing protein